MSPADLTLSGVVARLPPGIGIELLTPAGQDWPAGPPVILDSGDPQAADAHPIVLAVGVTGENEQLHLLGRLARTRPAAVVLRRPVSPPVVAAAESVGIAVLAAGAELPWGGLYTALLGAVATDDSAGDLFALANAVAAGAGAASTVEDPHGRLLAYSDLGHRIDPPRRQNILGRKVPEEWQRRLQDAGVFHRIRQSARAVSVTGFDVHGYRGRLAIAVRAGDEMLGSIWVVEGDEPLGREARRTLESAAENVALHLLRRRAETDPERRRRVEALTRLLDGASQDASGLGLVAPVTVIALGTGTGDAPADAAAARRIADLVALSGSAYRRAVASVALGVRAYALVAGTRSRACALAGEFADPVTRAFGLPVRAGVGPTVPALTGVAASRAEADLVLDVAGRNAPAVVRVEDVQARLTLHRLRRLVDQHPDLRRGLLVGLVEQDAARGTAWLPTLRAYLEAFGDVPAAAARVNVHPNTFRYRLRRITELFRLDLADPDVRLVAALELRLLPGEAG
ncbi:helix-turn-helix domain-containing protein [Nonomuraea sp. NPDC005650]|uniref:PucR family transcriptional regulator n=1 Tax=Nonomuraea sp. NPDC005650 TaxID=3157045 RepID=UPI0033BD428C